MFNGNGSMDVENKIQCYSYSRKTKIAVHTVIEHVEISNKNVVLVGPKSLSVYLLETFSSHGCSGVFGSAIQLIIGNMRPRAGDVL